MTRIIVGDLPHLCKLLVEVVDALVISIGKKKRGRPFIYSPKTIIKIFMIMVSFKLDSFRSLARFLSNHQAIAQCCGLKKDTPSYRTLSRRLTKLDRPIFQAVFQIVKVLHAHRVITLAIVSTDSSLLEAKGEKSHKNKPEIKAADPDARWGWSATRNWIFGYKLHITSTVLWRGEIIPLSWKTTPANVHDSKPFLGLIEQASRRTKESEGRIRFSLGDKSYDINKAYEWHDKNKMWLVTPVRRFKGRIEHPLKEKTKDFVDSDQGKRLYHRRADTERLFGQLKDIYQLDPLPVIGLLHVKNYCSIACFTFLCGVLYNHLNGRSTRAIKSLVA